MINRRIRRKITKLLSDLSDHEILCCIYALCNTLIRRSDNTITLEDILTSVWNLGKLVDHSRSESEDKEC